MKIQNKFFQLIKSVEKSIEIRKENSFYKIMNCLTSILFNNVNAYLDILDTMNGLIPVNVEINNCEHYKNLDFSEYSTHNKNCFYKLFFNGYERIKVSDLFNDMRVSLYGSWCHSNNDWFYKNIEFFKDYLKNEEYCIIYFIDIKETFKANGWELKNE